MGPRGTQQKQTPREASGHRHKHQGGEHTPRNWRTHLGSQTSRAPPPARGGTSERARVHSYAHSDTHTDSVTYVMHMEKPYPSQSPPRPPHHSPPPAPGSPQPRAPLAEEARVPAGCGAQGRGPAAGGSEARVPGTRRARRPVRPFIRQRPSGGAAAAAREAAAPTAALGQCKFSRRPATRTRSPTRTPPRFSGTGG